MISLGVMWIRKWKAQNDRGLHIMFGVDRKLEYGCLGNIWREQEGRQSLHSLTYTET